MRRMFTLRGVSGCGKSTKVKDIASWILINYPNAINYNIDLLQGDICGYLAINKLKIGFVSAGDDLGCVKGNDSLLSISPDIDIIVNSSRTKGITRQYLESNYNFSKGWLVKNIFVPKYNPSNPFLELSRDTNVLNEVKSWLTGLEKI